MAAYVAYPADKGGDKPTPDELRKVGLQICNPLPLSTKYF